MAEHMIVILSNRKPPKAVPGILVGDPDDSVCFHARGSDVQIQFWLWPFTGNRVLIELAAGQVSKPYTLKPYNETEDEYQYTVFCNSSGERATGASEPGIIIRRPNVRTASM
jgi:hypothetical protein